MDFDLLLGWSWAIITHRCRGTHTLLHLNREFFNFCSLIDLFHLHTCGCTYYQMCSTGNADQPLCADFILQTIDAVTATGDVVTSLHHAGCGLPEAILACRHQQLHCCHCHCTYTAPPQQRILQFLLSYTSFSPPYRWLHTQATHALQQVVTISLVVCCSLYKYPQLSSHW